MKIHYPCSKCGSYSVNVLIEMKDSKYIMITSICNEINCQYMENQTLELIGPINDCYLDLRSVLTERKEKG